MLGHEKRQRLLVKYTMKRPTLHTPAQSGFSIIEIAVTLVVLALLMTSALPNISSWMRNAKLRNQAEALLTGLQQARNEAVRRNHNIGFWMVTLPTTATMANDCTLSSSGTSWVVSASDPSSHCGDAAIFDTAPHIVTKHTGADGGTGVTVSGLKSDGTAASNLVFDGFGRATGDLRRVNISYASAQANDRALRIEVSTSGQARLCDVSVTVSGDPRKCSTGSFQ
jgi:type IV fimbrial biogenesis protein FimT